MKKVMMGLMVLLTAIGVNGGFIITEENDALALSDNHYTQGLELLYTGTFRQYEQCARLTGYGLKNVFYSPDDISIDAPPQDWERPYAGYTAIERKDWLYRKGVTRRIDWMIGAAGELSQSDHIQTWFHEIADAREPQGWEYQIPSEVFVNVGLEYNRPVLVFNDKETLLGTDLAAVYGGDLGTAFIDAKAGAVLRAGYNLPKGAWGGLIQPTWNKKRVSLFAFAEETGRVVAHNLMLGGSFFRDWEDYQERDLEPLVADTVVGGTFLVRKIVFGSDLGLTYRNVWRTDEFEDQELDSVFGSVSVALMKGF